MLYPETVSGKLLPTLAVAKVALAAEVTNVMLAASAANTQQTGWSNLYGAATTFAGGQSTDKGSSNINNSLSDPNTLSRLQVNSNLNKYATRQVNPLTSLKAGNSFLIK